MLKLKELKEVYAVIKLPSNAEVPDLKNGELTSITRTENELSIVCPQNLANFGGEIEKNWKGFFISGQLDFNFIGILESIARPLAKANISIFAISTFDTDYIFTKEKNFTKVKKVLIEAGFEFIT